MQPAACAAASTASAASGSCGHDTTGASRLDDASLLSSDLADGVAEQIGMVEADARDDGNVGCRNDVGGVQAAAKADLQHRNLASHLGEMQERHRRHKLELRWVVTGFHRHLLGMLPHLQRDARKVGHADVLAVHADALFEALDERAGEPAHAVASGLQHVGDIGARAALPVRARNMHDAQTVLGVAQARKQLADAIEAQTRRLPTGSVDIGDRIEVLRGVLRRGLTAGLRYEIAHWFAGLVEAYGIHLARKSIVR